MTQNLLEQPNNDQVEVDPNKDYLAELVGENAKFKTAQDLARGKFESDQYIEILKRRMDQQREDFNKLRDEYNASASLREIMDQMNNTQQLQTSRDDTLNSNVEPQKAAIDPAEIERLVTQKIQEAQTSAEKQKNYNQVQSKLQERFGNNYPSVLKEKIKPLGLGDEYVNELARTSPNAFFRLLGLDQDNQNMNGNFQAPIQNQKRNDNFAPNVQKRTWSYYEELRKSDPKAYYSPKIANQMHDDAIKLGEEFKDGNWNTV